MGQQTFQYSQQKTLSSLPGYSWGRTRLDASSHPICLHRSVFLELPEVPEHKGRAQNPEQGLWRWTQCQARHMPYLTKYPS